MDAVRGTEPVFYDYTLSVRNSARKAKQVNTHLDDEDQSQTEALELLYRFLLHMVWRFFQCHGQDRQLYTLSRVRAEC